MRKTFEELSGDKFIYASCCTPRNTSRDAFNASDNAETAFRLFLSLAIRIWGFRELRPQVGFRVGVLGFRV